MDNPTELPKNIHDLKIMAGGKFIWISIEDDLLTLWDNIDRIPQDALIGTFIFTENQLLAISMLKNATDIRNERRKNEQNQIHD